MQLVEHNSAQAFLDFLRPSSERWWNPVTGRQSHVFRGHADASWKLQPKGWRPFGANPEVEALYRAVRWSLTGSKTAGEVTHSDMARLWRFTLAEAAIQFASLGRSVGLEIPWQVENSLIASPRQDVPFIDLSLLALAQHHGVPTQLLDWSDDPLTSAFFAVDDPELPTDLCVWALEIEKVPSGKTTNYRLKMAPNIGNANIRAQSGLFLAFDQGPHLDTLFDGQWPSFESEELLSAALIQVRLPASERPTLHELLLRENRSKAHLMPSWDNVAETVRIEWATGLLWGSSQ
ncbi:FRG domain-containing protein [Rhizobium sp. S152]|uniref:FRG domain-containing protein n=1 Tax=Rhizobium sp. S152 TaxID=3055038 RepID=UPI0025A99D74|nr:FRG domain-containing protein [Rhizobium sp. S152]